MAFLAAAKAGDLETVQSMLAGRGASIGERDEEGMTALLVGAAAGRYTLVEWLLVEGGASITETSTFGNKVWDFLAIVGDHGALSSLLRVVTLLDDPPLSYVIYLSQQCLYRPGLRFASQIVAQGKKLRARLPVYLEGQCNSNTMLPVG
jgi:ankyrin repeat protein